MADFGNMQENLYDILARHFFSQATPEEEKIIEQYKIDHAFEYAQLHKLFTRGELTLKEFNLADAWQKVMAKHQARHPKQTRTIPLYRQFSRIAAGIALLIGLSLSVYFLSKNGSTVQPLILSANGSKQERVLLGDGSVVWLNDNARLIYPDEFAKEKRVVELLGEAFFEVARNTESPFVIHTQYADVQVLGTSFNVRTQKGDTEVTVATGTVEVRSNSTESRTIVNAGFSAKTDGGNVVAYRTSNNNYQAWRTGVFRFGQTPLSEVVAALNTYYTNKIQIAPDQKFDCGLTARFDRTPIHEVMEVLQLTCNISVEETKEGTFIIR